jgi:hypothetical protein
MEVQVCRSSSELVEGHEKCAHQERLAHEKCLQTKRLGSDPDAFAVWDTSSRHLIPTLEKRGQLYSQRGKIHD